MSLVGPVKKFRYMPQIVTLNQEETRNDLV